MSHKQPKYVGTIAHISFSQVLDSSIWDLPSGSTEVDISGVDYSLVEARLTETLSRLWCVGGAPDIILAGRRFVKAFNLCRPRQGKGKTWRFGLARKAARG